jgi:hypothetical protein
MILISALLYGCAGPMSSPPASDVSEATTSLADRSTFGLAAAREYLGSYFGSDPFSEFRKNKEEKALSFYSYGSLVYGDYFPGLTQQEVDLWITERHLKYVRMIQDDPQPFFVCVDFSIADYWDAVEEYLTTYNRLVIDHLNNSPTNR